MTILGLQENCSISGSYAFATIFTDVVTVNYKLTWTRDTVHIWAISYHLIINLDELTKITKPSGTSGLEDQTLLLQNSKE
jgi:hypothetical protein